MTVTSKQISILNLRTNISTSYTLHVTPHILNEPSHSASLSDYDVYALPTRPSHYEQTNLYNITTTVDTISLSSNTKYNVFTPSHVLMHSNPVHPHLTHPVVFLLLSHTTLPLALYHLSFKNISTFSLLLNVALMSLNLHLLLPFDVLTTLVTN